MAGLSLVLVFATEGAQAKGGGGTAKPPVGVPPPVIPSFPPVPAPVFSAAVTDIHQFGVTGYIQAVTVNDGSMCPNVDAAHRGGTIKVNGLTIIVPCNSIVQMPANTLTWVDANDPALPSLALGGAGAPYEASIVGNIVGSQHVAGLVYLSQQSVNGGQGVITSIDYTTGTIKVGGAQGAPDQMAVRINDPKGRFGRAQSPDPRFSVDDANPTIHGGTGYPMCVPRTDPSQPGGDDPLCPQKNRPKVVTQALNKGCRNFTNAGVSPLPTGGELSAPAAGQVFCSHFVMEDPAVVATDPSKPDPNQQAPFEVGDFVTYSGTLLTDPALGHYVSAHTIEANVGIWTQPNTQPSYLSIGEFGIGAADPAATAINGAAQETKNRIFLEASTTDVKSVVDIYMVDVDPKTGKENQRWITPFEMTGERNGPVLSTTGLPMGGGITTQFNGPQSQRARLRATKAPIGLLTSPTRTLRVAVRSLCTPTAINADVTPGTPCLQSKPAANGLFAGQYQAPVFEYIFPENTVVGDPVVPNDMWNLGFLVNGEGTDPGVGGPGRLTPTPW